MRDREDFREDWGNGSGGGDWVREYPEDNGRMAREFEPEDYCERHGCWKPYCKGKSHAGEDE